MPGADGSAASRRRSVVAALERRGGSWLACRQALSVDGSSTHLGPIWYLFAPHVNGPRSCNALCRVPSPAPAQMMPSALPSVAGEQPLHQLADGRNEAVGVERI